MSTNPVDQIGHKHAHTHVDAHINYIHTGMYTYISYIQTHVYGLCVQLCACYLYIWGVDFYCHEETP